jgi:hypothetical protein
MYQSQSLDAMVKRRLRQWPQRPPGVKPAEAGRDSWLRGRPGEDLGTGHPFLKLPGSTRWRTLPDGLWLNFGGSPVEPYVDIFAIEACGTLQNLLDKRSRFAPSTHSLLAVCPVPWLLAPVMSGDPTPRWKATGVLAREPAVPFVLPVRDMHVLYGLKSHHYAGFVRHQLPHAHEYFVPMEALTAKDSDKNPNLRALLAQASATANFLSAPQRRAPDPNCSRETVRALRDGRAVRSIASCRSA